MSYVLMGSYLISSLECYYDINRNDTMRKPSDRLKEYQNPFITKFKTNTKIETLDSYKIVDIATIKITFY